MGQPIEEAAKKSVGDPDLAAKLRKDGADAALDEIKAQAANNSVPDSAADPVSSPQLYMRAMSNFIQQQTAFIHQQGNLKLMFQAQLDFINEVCYYISDKDMASVLTKQEAFIAELQDLIQQKGLS
jgi:hypothetical protein